MVKAPFALLGFVGLYLLLFESNFSIATPPWFPGGLRGDARPLEIFSKAATPDDALGLGSMTKVFAGSGAAGILAQNDVIALTRIDRRLPGRIGGILWYYEFNPKLAHRQGDLLTIEGERTRDGRFYFAAFPSEWFRGVAYMRLQLGLPD